MMHFFENELLQLVRGFTLLGVDARLSERALASMLACSSNSRRLSFSAAKTSWATERDARMSKPLQEWGVQTYFSEACSRGSVTSLRLTTSSDPRQR
jgi:hypothetical protein